MGITPLMDNGHHHPTEVVSDKIFAMPPFHDKIALHVTRGVRWDSDHMVVFDDEIRDIAKETVRNVEFDRVFIATDYFDASINCISVWVTGMRSVEKAILYALLEPSDKFISFQENADFTSLMVKQEYLKEAPFGEVLKEYLRRENVNTDYLVE